MTWVSPETGDLSNALAATPPPPYTAVIFASRLRQNTDGYTAMAARMAELAAEQPGFLGVDSARDSTGLTVSYWATHADARAWKRVGEHLNAQARGKRDWYDEYTVRIATVEHDYTGPSQQ